MANKTIFWPGTKVGPNSVIIAGSVVDFASLPPVADHAGEIYYVETSTGVYLINRKERGLYISDGVDWLSTDVPSFFNDTNFRVYDDANNTKQLMFSVGLIAGSTVRTIIMPDKDVDLLGVGAAFDTTADAATVIWDWNSSINTEVTLAGSRILQIDNPVNGVIGIIKVIQGGAGSFSLTLPVNSKVKELGAGAIILTPDIGAIDLLVCIYDGTDFIWVYNLNFS